MAWLCFFVTTTAICLWLGRPPGGSEGPWVMVASGLCVINGVILVVVIRRDGRARRRALAATSYR